MKKDPTLITYADCVKQNKALLREDKRLAKLPKEVNIKQLASDVAYARRFGITLTLPPEMEQLVKEYLIKQQS
jgi:hypothetical protein